MSVQFRKYPVGVYNFERIVTEGYLYVDKTQTVYNLTQRFPYVFLSRPRRFGKSLLVDTLQCYFEARKELFKGLKLNALETEWIKYPVLRFDMSSIKSKNVQYVESGLDTLLLRYEKTYGIENPRKTFGDRLQALINAAVAQTGQKVVLLVDEYDSPMLEVFHDKEKLAEVRDILKNFYSPIKICDSSLRFGFLTGITKFSQMGIFSGINNLMDISMLDDYCDICGISKDELTEQCHPDIDDMAGSLGCSYEEMVQKLADNYDGYHFSENSKDIFNPFSLIKAFATKKLGMYWFESATPTFLFEQMNSYGTDFSDLEGVNVDLHDFNVSPENASSALPLLYQSGYLTIKKYDHEYEVFTLGFPNKEVRVGFTKDFLPTVATISATEAYQRIIGLTKAFNTGKIDEALNDMKQLVASIPYHYKNSNEADFQTIMYLILTLVGQRLRVEVPTAIGRSDAIIETQNYIYLIEYKVDKNPEVALQQIEQKNYAASYHSDPRKLIKVGINFSSASRGLESWKIV